MKLLIKFPTRGRFAKFYLVLMKYISLLSDIENTKFLITCDEDDSTMNNDKVKEIIGKLKNVEVVFGKSDSKIHAVNRDMELVSDYDIILLASDDMVPQIKGFDDIIRTKMKEHFPDTDGVLWFNDGFKKNQINTLCILGKKYYERFNYIYYPEYKSTWCDNEFTDVANILKKQEYFNEIIIKHEHPYWGFGGTDTIHTKNAIDEPWDMTLYKKRKDINFNIANN